MGTTAEKLQNILNAKNSISAAIELKGGTVPTELTGYGAAIEALPSGGSSEFTKGMVERSLSSISAEDLNGIDFIGERAFSRMRNLVSIDIPEGISAVKSRAFEECNSKASQLNIVFPSTAATFEDGIFSDAKNLKSVTFKGGIATITNSMFYACSNLDYCKFEQATLTSVQSQAFGGSQSGRLSVDFTALTSVPTVPGTAFPSSTKFLVNADYYNDFCEASNFSSVSARIFPITIE